MACINIYLGVPYVQKYEGGKNLQRGPNILLKAPVNILENVKKKFIMGKRDLLPTLPTLDKGPGRLAYPSLPSVGAPGRGGYA